MIGNTQVKLFLGMFLICLSATRGRAQDTVYAIRMQWEEKYVESVESRLAGWQKRTGKYSQKMLNKIIKQEKKMRYKVAEADSLVAENLFTYFLDSLQKSKAHIIGRFAPVQKWTHAYLPYIDTLKQSLHFLSKAKEVTKQAQVIQELQSSLNTLNELESKLGSIENLERYIAARQQTLTQLVKQYPQLASNLRKINKQACYYSEQIKQYKENLQNPSKLEETVIRTIEKQPAFQQFLQCHSELSSAFASPGSFSNLLPKGNMPVVNGLPSRTSLQAFVQSAIPSGELVDPTKQIAQQLPDLASGLNGLQNKINGVGGMGNKMLPGFTPNSQHTKSFWKRLEYGSDLQFGKGVRYLPATATIAAKLGYKLNDKTTVGTGVGYTMGLGSGWKNIRFSTQAVGLRTYLTWKVKKGLDIQGGSEWNYMLQDTNPAQKEYPVAWQQRVLIGLRKTYTAGKKLKGNVQVLYDFLCNRHLPASQPLLFRLGYSL